MRVAVVGGGIAGLAAARRLEASIPDAEVVLVEPDGRLGGKLVTERVDGFVVEGSADSFLARKERGVGLCEELGLGGELVARNPANARSFVRHGSELHPLPEGLTGMIPTDLEALAGTALLSEEGRRRLAAEVDLPPAPPRGDESIGAFVTRRLGREAYERLVEPLLTGIFGGDGDRLSLQATFPNLRQLELEHGSLLRGLAEHAAPATAAPAFLTLRGGMAALVERAWTSLERTTLAAGEVTAVRRGREGFILELAGQGALDAEGVVVAAPAYAAAAALAGLDAELAEQLASIPHASSAIVTLAYRAGDVPHPLAGYGYLVPHAEGSDVLACTWSSSKWEGRAPAGCRLLRVYVGRFEHDELAALEDAGLVELARAELGVLGIDTAPQRTWIHRWPRGMPQYVLGHPERLERIEARVAEHPGLALAGAAYRGVGIPDCIASGEAAADAVAHALVGAAR